MHLLEQKDAPVPGAPEKVESATLLEDRFKAVRQALVKLISTYPSTFSRTGAPDYYRRYYGCISNTTLSRFVLGQYATLESLKHIINHVIKKGSKDPSVYSLSLETSATRFLAILPPADQDIVETFGGFLYHANHLLEEIDRLIVIRNFSETQRHVREELQAAGVASTN